MSDSSAADSFLGRPCQDVPSRQAPAADNFLHAASDSRVCSWVAAMKFSISEDSGFHDAIVPRNPAVLSSRRLSDPYVGFRSAGLRGDRIARWPRTGLPDVVPATPGFPVDLVPVAGEDPIVDRMWHLAKPRSGGRLPAPASWTPASAEEWRRSASLLPADAIGQNAAKIQHTLSWFAKRIRHGADCLSRRSKGLGRPR